MKKRWTVYLPCISSEVYSGVEANSAKEALRKVRNGETACQGQWITGLEEEGIRIVKEEPQGTDELDKAFIRFHKKEARRYKSQRVLRVARQKKRAKKK